MSKNNQIMLDIECLNTTPDAIILSISAVAFDAFEITEDFSNNPKLDILVDIESQDDRSISEDTIQWWGKQPKETKNKIFSEHNRVPLKESLLQLTKFAWLKERIWVQGVGLDSPVLDHAFNQCEIPVPWIHWQVRDARTLRDFVDEDKVVTSHDSLDDCIQQIKKVQLALYKLGITKFHKK